MQMPISPDKIVANVLHQRLLAWESNDAEWLSTLYTRDCSVVWTTGARLVGGRVAVKNAFGRFFELNKGSKLERVELEGLQTFPQGDGQPALIVAQVFQTVAIPRRLGNSPAFGAQVHGVVTMDPNVDAHAGVQGPSEEGWQRDHHILTMVLVPDTEVIDGTDAAASPGPQQQWRIAASQSTQLHQADDGTHQQQPKIVHQHALSPRVTQRHSGRSVVNEGSSSVVPHWSSSLLPAWPSSTGGWLKVIAQAAALGGLAYTAQHTGYRPFTKGCLAALTAIAIARL